MKTPDQNHNNQNRELHVHGRALITNSILNLIGHAIPVIIAIILMPYIIHYLGVDRFGVFSLGFVVSGYFSIFDFGLGRATTKFVSEALGKSDSGYIRKIFWVSLFCIIFLSIIGSLALLLFIPILVTRILNIPPSLVNEAMAVFRIVAISLPFTLIKSNLSGLIEAYQRFDLVNLLKVPSSVLAYIIPAAVLYMHGGLILIFVGLLIKDAIILIFYFISCLKIMPKMGSSSLSTSKVVNVIFSFGGWIALLNIAVALLLYLDRIMVGALLNMAAVTYYTVPYELINKASVINASIIMTLFPAISFISNIDKDRLQRLFRKAVKYIFLIMLFFISAIMVFSRDILFFWMGQDFALKSTFVLQILAIGIFLSSFAWLGAAFLQGMGKPKVVTLIHLIQIPAYIIFTWIAVKTMDIQGAALSWTLRTLVTVVLLFLALRTAGIPCFSYFIKSIRPRFIIIFGSFLAMTAFAKTMVRHSLLNISLIFLIYGIVSLFIFWLFGLDDSDRLTIGKLRNV